MPGHRHSAALLLPHLLHVDADGGRGPVRGSGPSLHQEADQLHHRVHTGQLRLASCIHVPDGTPGAGAH